MNDEIKDLLEKNMVMTEEIYDTVKRIKKYIFMAQIMGVINFIIIVAPIVLALIYLPPLLKNFFSQYQNILPNLNQINFSSINELLKNIKPQ